ncbi:MAG: glutathione S-transferase [Hellea sp.]
MLKLYDCTTAPSPRRARMLLAEKGIEHENIQIDLRTGEQMSDAYRKINPRCTVPALVTDEGVMTENAEITAYLEAAFPDTPMLGTTPREKSLVAKWNWRCEMEGLMSIAHALRNSTPAMKGRALPGPRDIEQIPKLAARGQKQIAWFLEDLNTQLTDNAYVAGAHYSAADITATVVVDFAKWVKVVPTESQKALLEWHERMKARPNYNA